LPRETKSATTPQPIGQPHVDLHESRPNALIVDDERDAREMLALALKTRGAEVRHVGHCRRSTAEENNVGLARLASGSIAVILPVQRGYLSFAFLADGFENQIDFLFEPIVPLFGLR
jgi:hypothetical protein